MAISSIFKELARIGAAAAIAAPIGGYIGYTKAINTPVPSQYAVIDLKEYVKTITGKDVDPNKMSGQIAMQEAAEAIKGKLKEYTDEGVVILDASTIVAAPAGAYIKPGEK